MFDFGVLVFESDMEGWQIWWWIYNGWVERWWVVVGDADDDCGGCEVDGDSGGVREAVKEIGGRWWL